MIRATELAGRSVVDIDAAEKVGSIEKIILDLEDRHVAGFVVAAGRSGLPGTKSRVAIPAAAVHAIGPDAVTVRSSAVAGNDIGRLETLPTGSDVIGRKVVSEDGRLLGKVSDILVDYRDGAIFGYLLSDHTPGRRWAELAGSDKSRKQRPYLPADVKIHAGRDLIVVSEDVLGYDWPDDDLAPHETGTNAPNWEYGESPSPIENRPAR